MRAWIAIACGLMLCSAAARAQVAPPGAVTPTPPAGTLAFEDFELFGFAFVTFSHRSPD